MYFPTSNNYIIAILREDSSSAFEDGMVWVGTDDVGFPTVLCLGLVPELRPSDTGVADCSALLLCGRKVTDYGPHS